MKMFVALVICLGVVLLPGCGRQIVDAQVKEGTLVTTVNVGDTVDTSNVVVIYTYEDDEIESVSASALEFSTVDTSVATDNAKLTIKYGNYSFDVTIVVVDA